MTKQAQSKTKADGTPMAAEYITALEQIADIAKNRYFSGSNGLISGELVQFTADLFGVKFDEVEAEVEFLLSQKINAELAKAKTASEQLGLAKVHNGTAGLREFLAVMHRLADQ